VVLVLSVVVAYHPLAAQYSKRGHSMRAKLNAIREAIVRAQFQLALLKEQEYVEDADYHVNTVHIHRHRDQRKNRQAPASNSTFTAIGKSHLVDGAAGLPPHHRHFR
jgi:hypothetical protein